MLIKLTNRQMMLRKDTMMDEELQAVKHLLFLKEIEYAEDSNNIVFSQSAHQRYYILYELSKHHYIELM